MLHRVLSIACLGLAATSGLQEVKSNDNTSAAGRLEAGLLTVNLTAAAGAWFPEEKDGPAHQVYAFGEEGRGLSTPGPMLRVPVGTQLKVTVANRISGTQLEVHGLHGRPGGPDVLVVPSGETRTVRFRVTSPGTYFYWGSTRGVTRIQDRFGPESQLMGALIVDPPGDVPLDHVYMIGIEDDSGAIPANRRIHAAVINGRSWPHSQISTVPAGDTVRMRWINASDRTHPIHLHGFYFTVNGRGDIAQDTSYDDASRRLAVTELMLQGRTMSVSWVPERRGNWLMHCHMAAHMSPDLRAHHTAMGGKHNHTMEAMAGLVIGWRVLPNPKSAVSAEAPASAPRRNLRLLVQQSSRDRYWGAPGMGFVLQDGATPAADSVEIPGPPIVLTRGQPVQITVVNHLRDATSIHWHGIELDSYFDGVSGWSGDQRKTAPHVNPGDSFAVRFTPPRAGTFIYHSHYDEERQLGSGMYGPIIVLEPGKHFDPKTDLPWILSQAGPTKGAARARITVNGSRSPVLEMQAGVLHRIRLIHIAATLPLKFSILRDTLLTWRAVAKDGADLPLSQALVRPAQQMIGVGEAYDFEFTPEKPGELRVVVQDLVGVTRVAGLIRIRP